MCLCVGPSNAPVSVRPGCAFVGLGNVCPWDLALAVHLHLWALEVYVSGFWQLVSVEPSNAYICVCGSWQCMSVTVGSGNVCLWGLAMHLCLWSLAMHFTHLCLWVLAMCVCGTWLCICACGFWQCVSVGSGNVCL